MFKRSTIKYQKVINYTLLHTKLSIILALVLENDRLPISIKLEQKRTPETVLLALKVSLLKRTAAELLRSNSTTNLHAVLEGMNVVIDSLNKIKPLGS